MKKGFIWFEVMFAAAIVAVLLLVAVSCKERSDHFKMLNARGCKLVDKVMTGDIVKYGKSSYRPEMKLTYQCNDGPHVEIE